MSVWASGTRLGPYELTVPLGGSGMGEVWKARDTRVDRIVAIKRLKAEHAEQFTREARAIAARESVLGSTGAQDESARILCLRAAAGGARRSKLALPKSNVQLLAPLVLR